MRSVFFFFIFFYIHLIAILHLATNILVPHSIQSAVCVCRDPLYLAPRACRRRRADDDYDAPDEEERRPIDFSLKDIDVEHFDIPVDGWRGTEFLWGSFI